MARKGSEIGVIEVAGENWETWLITFGVALAGAVGGVYGTPAGATILGLAVPLLLVRDRGQYRGLWDKTPEPERVRALAMAVGSFYGLYVLVVGVCYGVGRGLMGQ